MHKYAGRRANVELAGAVGGVRFRFRTGGLSGRRGARAGKAGMIIPWRGG